MARTCVKSQQNDICQQHKRTYTDSNPIRKEEAVNCIPPQEGEKYNRDIKKPAMKILQNEREGGLAAVAPLARFANSAGRRIQKERAIVRLSIVVAGRPESERSGQNQTRRRKSPPVGSCVDQRRMKRREVGAVRVTHTFQGSKSGVDTKRAQK